MTAEQDMPLWQPSPAQANSTQMAQFLAHMNSVYGLQLQDSVALHRYSIDHPETFWSAVWDFCGIIGEKGGSVLRNANQMPGAQFFPDALLNFAENLLRKNDDSDALVFWGEDQVKRRTSWCELHALVSCLQQFLTDEGVVAGDRVAAMLPNLPETAALMLACASLGAVFSSCSPDFGVQGVLDRFAQIEPKIFVACDGVFYNGKKVPVTDRALQIASQLPSLKKVLIIPYIEASAEVTGAVTLPDILKIYTAKPVTFARLPFNHPQFILFSSGTTGIPKCIVHTAGGTLLQLVKEHRLHCDIRQNDRVFYFTTCGWMMWNWLVSALASEAVLLLYDGSPFAAHDLILFDYAVAENMTLFGTSAKYIETLRKNGALPKLTHDLSPLRTMTSTGSPLSSEGFEYVYSAIKPDLHLASISGGTDIVSCFVLGDPTRAVWLGEIQGAGLGMAVDVLDEQGQPCPAGVKGELVCTHPFPSMPLKFWNDADGIKYRAAYFDRFANIWCHGDFAEKTPHGGLIIHGRSDATLNPGGVRIGTAEIYAQVEKVPDVMESLCIGQDFDGDVRIVLFVRLREGCKLDDRLTQTIKHNIKTGASPRHVPAKIIAVDDIPRTKSGKIVELAVREVVHGRDVKNKEALANPEALALFRNLSQLEF